MGQHTRADLQARGMDPCWVEELEGAPRRPRSARAHEAWLSILIIPVVCLLTLPQTLLGLVAVAVYALRGARPYVYRFGLFWFLVVPREAPIFRGISLGLVVVAFDPAILRHEFCHLITGLWLVWFYLPWYALEYAIFGHYHAPHERLVRSLEGRISWDIWRVQWGNAS